MRGPPDYECDPGQDRARRQFSRNLLCLLVSYNDLCRQRNVTVAIAASVQSVAQLDPSLNADCVRALIDSLHAGVDLGFPESRRSTDSDSRSA